MDDKFEDYKKNYLDKLNNIRKFMKITDNSKNTCVDVLSLLIEETINEVPEEKEQIIRTISKDLSRYFDSWNKYQVTLSEMDKSSNLRYLRKKLVLEPRVFKEIWKESSDNFFRTRKMFDSLLKNKSLVVKLNSTLDCIVTGLNRYLDGKYGEETVRSNK